MMRIVSWPSFSILLVKITVKILSEEEIRGRKALCRIHRNNGKISPTRAFIQQKMLEN